MRKLRPWNTELALASQSVQLHEMLMPTEFPKENGAIKDSSQQSKKGNISSRSGSKKHIEKQKSENKNIISRRRLKKNIEAISPLTKA